ncbi:MAG: DUF898 family protein [Pseudomonadota bacterium]
MAVLSTRFDGGRGELFLLALRVGFLTLVTAGIYRFWAKTRLRRWFWSAVKPGGTPMEYTGTALEKLTGFLLAIILLAFVLTAINLGGIAISINLMDDAHWSFFAAAGALPAAILPLFYFARYRARRYILSRSRWRGIRFGMSSGAVGYAWRATLYLLLTIATLGLLWPLMTFRLEKYLTDRTWYGTARFSQHGSMWRLYGPAFPFLLMIWGMLAFSVYASMNVYTDFSGLIPILRGEVWAIFAAIACGLLALLFSVYYRVASIRVLAALKTLGDGVEFDLWPKTLRVFRIYFFGALKTYFATIFVYNVVFGFVFAVLWLAGGLDATQIQAMMANPPMNVVVVLGVLTYLMIVLLANVFRQTFITHPLVVHVAETLEIHQPELLGTVRQRSADSRTDAGGFAEALDAGAAF